MIRDREAPRANISLNPADIRRKQQQRTTVERFVITRERRYVVVVRVYISLVRAIPPRPGRAWSGKRESPDYLPRDEKKPSAPIPVPFRLHARGERKLRASCIRVHVNWRPSVIDFFREIALKTATSTPTSCDTT